MAHQDNEFLNKFKGLIKVARLTHSSVIESIPRNDREPKFKQSENRLLTFSDQNQVKLAKSIGSQIATAMLEMFADQITINLQGHNMLVHKESLSEHIKREQFRTFSINQIAQLQSFSIAQLVFSFPKVERTPIDALELLEGAYNLIDIETGYLKIIDDRFKCRECGRTLNILLNTNTLEIGLYPTYERYNDKTKKSEYKESEPCKYPNGVGEYSIDIDVPSGKLIIANALTSVMPKSIHDNCCDYISEKIGNYVTTSECNLAHVEQSNYYAQNKLMYLQAGNRSPAVFYNAKTHEITIKDEYVYSVDGEEIQNFSDNEKCMGNISMDLWASTGMDYDVFCKYCQDVGLNPNNMIEDLDAIVIDVKSGKYKATNFWLTDKYSNNGLFVKISPISGYLHSEVGLESLT